MGPSGHPSGEVIRGPLFDGEQLCRAERRDLAVTRWRWGMSFEGHVERSSQ